MIYGLPGRISLVIYEEMLYVYGIWETEVASNQSVS